MIKWKINGNSIKSTVSQKKEDWQNSFIENNKHKCKLILLIIPFLVLSLLFLSFSLIDDLSVKPNDISHAKEISHYYHTMKDKGYQFNDHQRQVYSYYDAFFDSNGEYQFLNYPHAVIFYGSDAHRESYISAAILSAVFFFLAFCLSLLFIKLLSLLSPTRFKQIRLVKRP